MCNKDCFNCPYPDCIRDEGQDERDRVRKWREENPGKVKEIRRRQYLKNREKEKEQQREYYKKLKNSERYAEYRKERNAYLREYRKRKKEGVVSG